MGRHSVRLPGLFLAYPLALLLGCAWPPASSPKPWEERRLIPLSSSLIYEKELFLGRLKEFEFPDPDLPSRLWLLENEHGQWVGWIDGVGRAFKLVAHERGARHIATGSLSLCVQALLGLTGTPRLDPEWAAEAP